MKTCVQRYKTKVQIANFMMAFVTFWVKKDFFCRKNINFAAK